jgi:Fungal Zn(2)-Cys(6) binuclear cluster domain
MASTTSPDDPFGGQANEPGVQLPLNHQGSCVTCRRRKVKCDKTPFCSNCQRLGLHCEYAPRKRASRQPRKTDGLSTREVELIKRLNKLEGGPPRPGVFCTIANITSSGQVSSSSSVDRHAKKKRSLNLRKTKTNKPIHQSPGWCGKDRMKVLRQPRDF